MLGRGFDHIRCAGAEQGLVVFPGGAVVVHRFRIAALDNGHHFLAGDGLLLQQVRGDLIQQLAVVTQDLLGLLVALADDLNDSAVGGGVGFLGAGHGVSTVQILILHRTKRHHVELLAHAEAGHQVAGQLCGAFNIVGGAGGHGVAHNLFRAAACQQGADLGQNILPGHEEFFLLRQMQRITQRALRMGHDRDFRYGLCVFLLGGHQGMTHLVISDDALFLLGDDGALLFAAGDDHFKSGQQVVLIDRLAALADGTQCGFVHQIGQIRTHAAGGGLGDLLQIHIFRQVDVAGMHLQRGQTAGQIGAVNGDAAVEAAGTQQRLIQHLGAVGGAQHDDTLAGVEAVQLGQQLVQRLLALIVAAEAAAVTGFADGVNFVDKDNARCHLGGLLKEVAHAAGAHAHEHLHKVRTGDGEERHIGLTGHGLGQQRFAGTGRAHQQGALGELGADGGVFLRIVEEVDDLLQRFLCLVLTGHILEGDAGGLFHIDLGIGLAHIADAADAAAALGEETHQQHEHAHHQNGRHDVSDHELQHRRHLGLVGAGVFHMVLIEQRQQIVVGKLGSVERDPAFLLLLMLLAVLIGVNIAVHRGGVNGVVLKLHIGHLIVFHHFDKFAVLHLVAGGPVGGIAGVSAEIIKAHGKYQGPRDQRENTAQIAIGFAVFILIVLVIRVHKGPPSIKNAEALPFHLFGSIPY